MSGPSRTSTPSRATTARVGLCAALCAGLAGAASPAPADNTAMLAYSAAEVAGVAMAGTTPFAPAAGVPACVALVAGPDPYVITLVPTAHANGARGTARLRFAESPFGITVTAEGHHLYDIRIDARGLPADGRALVAWAATPDLDRVQRLGTLDRAGALEARIAFNKFLVFVTAEPAPDVERWSGPILLRGISPSGRMHTMAGHGPFQGEPCAAWGFAPAGPAAPAGGPPPDGRRP